MSCNESQVANRSRGGFGLVGEHLRGSPRNTPPYGDRPQAGFTLVELMVVIVIIGLLAGTVGVGVRSYLIAGRQSVAKMEIAKICQAIDTFYSVYNRYPTNEEGIEVLARASEKFADGLLTKVPVDPWGHAYEYLQPARNGPYEVICYGADGRERGEGADRDLTSEDLGDNQS